MFRMGHILWMAVLAALLAGCGKDRVAEAERGERGASLYRKAFAAEQAGDIKEAVRLFNKVLLEDPRSYSAHFQLATLLQDHEEDYYGAIYHYKRYLELRPESEKNTLANDRIRVAEQRLAPQILKKVGDSVQSISQANLLKENERLNHAITTLEGEKSVLLEEKAKVEKSVASLKGDNERLRDILRKMRVDESAPQGDAQPAKSIGAAVRESAGADTGVQAKTDAQTMRALREEATALAKEGSKPSRRLSAAADTPTTEAVLKKVGEQLTGDATQKEAVAKSPPAAQTQPSTLSMLARPDKNEKKATASETQRTYVVQPGDTLFRVSEKFYGDSTKWKRIREANRTRIDPDGRIRAGQIIVVP